MFYFYLSFIHPPDSQKTSEALYLEQLSGDYPDLLAEMSKYCCAVKTFFCFF